MHNMGKRIIITLVIVVLLGICGAIFFAFHNSRSITIGKTGSGTVSATSSMPTATTTPSSTGLTVPGTLSNATTTASDTNIVSGADFPPIPTSSVTFPPVDTVAYDAKMLSLANIPPPYNITTTVSTRVGSTTKITYVSKTVTPTSIWPTKTAPYPDAGAILPFDRIVAYYGNLYSTQMGILGQYPEQQVLSMLASTTKAWQAADPSTPTIPALDYIAVSAQASPGPDGKYRLRMPDSQINEILKMASQINGLVFLDIQVGLSNVETEVPLLQKYLAMPNVELSLDPEFDMHNGARPGTVIGTMDASDINWAEQYLASLVKQNNLPPKILVVHRFTLDMVTNTNAIKPLPEVEFVMDMDGFGFPAKKVNTYQTVIEPYPIQFTGFKLFYKNDTNAGHLMTPAEVLKLSPQPSYIQYQ
jgi:hypothetical protein